MKEERCQATERADCDALCKSSGRCEPIDDGHKCVASDDDAAGLIRAVETT